MYKTGMSTALFSKCVVSDDFLSGRSLAEVCNTNSNAESDEDKIQHAQHCSALQEGLEEVADAKHAFRACHKHLKRHRLSPTNTPGSESSKSFPFFRRKGTSHPLLMAVSNSLSPNKCPLWTSMCVPMTSLMPPPLPEGNPGFVSLIQNHAKIC